MSGAFSARTQNDLLKIKSGKCPMYFRHALRLICSKLNLEISVQCLSGTHSNWLVLDYQDILRSLLQRHDRTSRLGLADGISRFRAISPICGLRSWNILSCYPVEIVRGYDIIYRDVSANWAVSNSVVVVIVFLPSFALVHLSTDYICQTARSSISRGYEVTRRHAAKQQQTG